MAKKRTAKWRAAKQRRNQNRRRWAARMIEGQKKDAFSRAAQPGGYYLHIMRKAMKVLRYGR